MKSGKMLKLAPQQLVACQNATLRGAELKIHTFFLIPLFLDFYPKFGPGSKNHYYFLLFFLRPFLVYKIVSFSHLS